MSNKRDEYEVLPLTDLVGACINGDSRAQRCLYDRYAPMLMLVCRRYTGDPELAREVLSDAFIKIFNSLKNFRFEGSFDGWIKRIAVRQAIDAVRKNKNIPFFDKIENIEIKQEDTALAEEQHQLDMEELLQILDSLPSGYRTVFCMYAIEGMSHREIADTLEITENTSKSQLFKARILLKQKCLDKIRHKKISAGKYLQIL